MRYAIWGAGKYGRILARYLLTRTQDEVAAFIDRNAGRLGGEQNVELDGVSIRSIPIAPPRGQTTSRLTPSSSARSSRRTALPSRRSCTISA